MQYKRFLTACLIVILMLCTAVVSIGAAESETAPFELAVEVSSSTAVSKEPFVLQAGDSFEVSISINNNPGISVFVFDLDYNTEALTLVETEDGAIDFAAGDVVPGITLKVFKFDENTIRITNTGSTEFKTNGLVAKLKFIVNEDGYGDSEVKITKNQAMNTSWDMFYPEVKANTSTVSVHQYDAEPVVTAPTCLEDGYKTYTCSVCKEDLVLVDKGTATGHAWSTEYTWAEDGKSCVATHVCANDKAHNETANGVITSEVTKPSACTSTGDTKYTATFDVEWATTQTKIVADISETGHKPGAAATCTTAQTCTVCNAELAPALGHKPGAAATCTTAQTCTVCNAELAAALGHKPGAAATCTTAQTCTVCNAELAAALGHKPGAAATCTTAQTCTVCNAELAAALGHKPGAAATCTTAQTCTVCNAELAAALGHKPGAAATCTTAQTCTVCNAELAAALGHTEAVDAAVAPTCTETGLTEGKHCSVCNEVLVAQDVVPALGHTEVIDAAVEPTYFETGLTEGKHCSVCEEVLLAQETVEKKSMLWIFLVAGGAVIAAGGAAVAIVFIIKKKKH